MSEIPDITQSEDWIIDTTLKERYGREVERQYGDAEIRLSPADKELSSCPMVYWQADGCNFIIFKTGERRYRCQFFYRGYLMGRLDDIFRGRIRLLGARVGWGLLIQAALFAVGHFLVDLNPQRLGVFFPALAFGWLRARRGTIVAPVVFHAAANVFMEVFRAGYGLR